MNTRVVLQHWFGALGLIVAFAGPARAEPTYGTRRAAAEALFSEGRRLLREGKPLEACPKFAESQKLDSGIGTLLNLARCYALLGRTASAWAAYSEAASLAHTSRQTERESFAAAKAEELAATLPKLEVRVPESASATIELTIDDDAWSRGLWNIAAPIDPGPHVLVAKAPGFAPWSTTFDAKPGEGAQIVVPELKPAPQKAEAKPELRERRGAGGWSLQKTGATVGAAVGLAAIAMGTALALDAKSTYDRSEAHCTADQRCEPQGLEFREDAFDKARMATIAFGFGTAALAGSTILWFTAPSTGSADKRAMVGVRGQW